MKIFFKSLACFFIFCCTINTAAAQTPFNTNSHILHAGLGLGGYGISFNNGINASPMLSVTYDQGIIDDLGIGNLGVGGGFGIKNYNFKGNNSNLTRTFVGARATYHFDFVNSDNFDFYAGIMAGIDFYSGSIDGFNAGTSLFGGPLAGINYWFKPSFGIYAEAGHALGVLNGGVFFGF